MRCTSGQAPPPGRAVDLEGCLSCPRPTAGERLRASASARPVVPLSLHVDYGKNYIGCKDPLLPRRCSRPARRARGIARSRVVYTPQVVLAGKDYRGWSSQKSFAQAVAAVNAGVPRARIELAFGPAGAGTTMLRAAAAVPAPLDRESVALYVALYENELSNRVSASENRGATHGS